MSRRKINYPLPRRGVDLLSDETSLPAGAVRRAENVDIRRDGAFKRRDGYEVAYAGADFHSLFATKRGVLAGRGTQLCALHPETMVPAPLLDTGSFSPMDFIEWNGHTYIINEGGFWFVPANEGAPRTVGVPLPNALPGMEPTTGTLLPGQYAVGLSWVDDRGEESSTKIIGHIDLPEGGGIRLTGLETNLSRFYRVYLTPPDGDVLYLSEEFAAALPQFVVTRQPDGATRTSQHLMPMPGGQFVRAHNGRLYVAHENELWFSEAMRPHLRDPRYNFIQFVGQIRFIEPVQSGIYVADDRGVWFLSGADPSDAQQALASDSLAVARSSIALHGAHLPRDLVPTDTAAAVWLSENGYAVGLPDGSVSMLHPSQIHIDPNQQGRSTFLVRDGIKQIITLTAATEPKGYGVAIDSTLQ